MFRRDTEREDKMKKINIKREYDGVVQEIEYEHDAEYCLNPRECTGKHYHTSNCRCQDCMDIENDMCGL